VRGHDFETLNGRTLSPEKLLQLYSYQVHISRRREKAKGCSEGRKGGKEMGTLTSIDSELGAADGTIEMQKLLEIRATAVRVHGSNTLDGQHSQS
jgi:hypothetical protein